MGVLSAASAPIEQSPYLVESVYPAIDHEVQRRPSAKQRIRVRELWPLIRKFGVGIKDMECFVDPEQSRNPNETVKRQDDGVWSVFKLKES